MSLVYVTGVPGTGKTTVGEYLRARDQLVFDVDNDNLANPVNNGSCEVVTDIEATHNWHHDHSFELDELKLAAIGLEAGRRAVFVCGTVTDDTKYWNWFNMHFALTADPSTIDQRLRERTNHTFGKAKAERQLVLGNMARNNVVYKTLGARMLDGSQPPEVLADRILDDTHRVLTPYSFS